MKSEQRRKESKGRYLKLLMYGGACVSVAKWFQVSGEKMLFFWFSGDEVQGGFEEDWDYEAFGEPSAEVLAAQEAAAFKTLEAVASARAHVRRSREAADPTARRLETLVRTGRVEEALSLAQETLDVGERDLAELETQMAETENEHVRDEAAARRNRILMSAGDVHYWKGVALMGMPSSRCAGGTCRQHAAASFADCVKFRGARSEDANFYLLEATTDLRGIDGTRPERVKALFDEYSETFESHLTKELRYQAPTILSRAVARLFSSNNKDHTKKLNVTLDVGCGTGLVARELRQHLRASDRIYGYDLSPKMVALSRRNGLYDSLTVCDARHLSKCGYKHPKPDLVVFADVLCYLDDVDAARVLTEAGGLLGVGLEASAMALTVERPSHDTERLLAKHKGPNWKCILGSTGRYAHNLDWLVSFVTDLGFDLAWIAELCDTDCQYPPLRYERGLPVSGAIIIFTRRQTTTSDRTKNS